MKQLLNIAHRGAAQLWPENTLSAFVNAAKSGCDAAELDVQLTRDDRLIIFHDFRLKPAICRNPAGQWLRASRFRRPQAIRELGYDTLREYDVGRARPGSLYARRHVHVQPHDGAAMPSLKEVIDGVVRVNPEFRLFIEIKTALRRGLSAPAEAVADAVLDELRARNFLGNAVLVGFDWAGLVHAKKRDHRVRCWFSTLPRWRGGARRIAQSGGDGWFCPLSRANKRTIANAREAGLRFGVWTVNRRRDMQRLIDAEVDGICTDRPDRLQQVIARRT
jgi:glycerophosphoryl diester phosphodiesterase